MDLAAGTPFDKASVYLHTAVLTFINFPFDLEPEASFEAWPRRNHDATFGFHAWRNRFRDENDVIVSVLDETMPGFYIRASAARSCAFSRGVSHCTLEGAGRG